MKLVAKILLTIFLLGGAFLVLANLVYWLDYETKIALDGGERPTFILSGSGRMSDFVILGPRQRPGNGRESVTVWELEPDGQSAEAEFVRAIGSIKWGAVPKGYKQVWPKNSVPPPALKPGETYQCWIMTDNAPWGLIAFELHDGKAIGQPLK